MITITVRYDVNETPDEQFAAQVAIALAVGKLVREHGMHKVDDLTRTGAPDGESWHQTVYSDKQP